VEFDISVPWTRNHLTRERVGGGGNWNISSSYFSKVLWSFYSLQSKKFLLQSRSARETRYSQLGCNVSSLTYLSIMHLKTRKAILMPRRQDFAYIYICVCVYTYMYIGGGGGVIYHLASVCIWLGTAQLKVTKKNVSYNSTHLYQIRSNVDRGTKEFNQSLRGTEKLSFRKLTFRAPSAPLKSKRYKESIARAKAESISYSFPTEGILNFKCGCVCMCVWVYAFTHSA